MKNYRKVMSDFLICYELGNWDNCKELVNDDIVLESTLAGTHRGIEEIKSALQLPKEHNISNMVITNLIHREADGHDIVWCYMHHMTGVYQGRQLFPLIYGGKLYFDICNNRITNIKFELGYEYGNTWAMNGIWKFYEETKNTHLISADALRLGGETRGLRDLVNRFFWSVDHMDRALFQKLCSRDVEIIKSGIDSSIYKKDGVFDVDRYLRFEKDFYEQNLYSIHIVDESDIDPFHKKITCWHLSPGRPGTKHYGANTIYMQFYDEIIDVEFHRDKDGWKIGKVIFTAKSNQAEYSPKFLML